MRAILPQTTGQRVVAAVTVLILGVILVAVLQTVTAGHDKLNPPAQPVPAATTATDQTVVLQVTADDIDGALEATSVQVTWLDGGAESQTTADLPWTQLAAAPASLTAQNQGDTGTIHCRIWQGSTVLQESQASGAYGVCSVTWVG